MHLEKLELVNYRNYGKITFNFSPYLNIIIGGNAQGKTNILEAIYYLSSGGSHRQAPDSQLIKQRTDLAAIKSQLNRADRKLSLEVFLIPGQRRRIKVGGAEKTKMSDLLGNLHAVIFSPEDLQIVKGGPEHRRAFLDETLVQINPTYHHWRRSYERILRQRNILLKSFPPAEVAKGLELWDKNLIEVGSKIIFCRAEVVERLNKFVRKIHSKITEKKEKLDLVYASKVAAETFDDIDMIAEEFRKELLRRRRDEIDRKVTLVGSHRDDLVTLVNSWDMRSYGSQGQQRTVALSLKLGQFKLIEEEAKEKPLLLLDDVMSELDEARRADLMAMIKDGTQVLVTTATEDVFQSADLKGQKVMRIRKGSLINAR